MCNMIISYSILPFLMHPFNVYFPLYSQMKILWFHVLLIYNKKLNTVSKSIPLWKRGSEP